MKIGDLKTEGLKGLRYLFFGLLLIVQLGLAQTLTVLTHDSFAISEDVMAAFTAQTGIKVEFIAGGDAGETLNRAILTKNAPLADLFYGIDNSLLTRALKEGIFEPYQSLLLMQIDSHYQFDPNHFVTPIDTGYVNFNMDKAYFLSHNLALPTDVSDLLKAAYKGLSVVTNPATSSPGLAFMLATIDRFGLTGDYTWLDFWAELRDNDLAVVSGWNEAYYTAFSLYGGDRPIVLSYASSPAAEVMFAETPLTDAPSANLFCEKCVFEQIEAVGILKGGKNLAAAQSLIDFMLSEVFQADIAPNMFVYPIRNNVKLPEAFDLYSQTPDSKDIATLEPSQIDTNLETWLSQWTQVVEQGRNPKDAR
jgi:thiamine transport system substrate-binding protein